MGRSATRGFYGNGGSVARDNVVIGIGVSVGPRPGHRGQPRENGTGRESSDAGIGMEEAKVAK